MCIVHLIVSYCIIVLIFSDISSFSYVIVQPLFQQHRLLLIIDTCCHHNRYIYVHLKFLLPHFFLLLIFDLKYTIDHVK